MAGASPATTILWLRTMPTLQVKHGFHASIVVAPLAGAMFFVAVLTASIFQFPLTQHLIQLVL